MYCLKKLKIDGVAYMSTKSKGEMDFPLNVCLALPVFDDQRFDKTFEITEPILLEKFINLTDRGISAKKSFINAYYETKSELIADISSDVPYFKHSIYSAFDDYLINQEYKQIETEKQGDDN